MKISKDIGFITEELLKVVKVNKYITVTDDKLTEATIMVNRCGYFLHIPSHYLPLETVKYLCVYSMIHDKYTEMGYKNEL